MERKRERDLEQEQVYFWDPFKNAPLTVPAKRHESRLATEVICRKRGADEPCGSSPGKRGNFLAPLEPDPTAKLGAKRTLVGEEDDQGFKRCKPVYWRAEDHGTKRSAEEGSFLIATKKGRQEEEVLPLVVSRPDRVTLLDDDDDISEPWYKSLELSRVPKPLGRELPPEQRVVVWRDQEECVLERLRRGAPHPPLESARGRMRQLAEPPRVEVMESDEEGEEEEEGEEDTGLAPMDLSD
jgi:hypothetical protein